ncbi:MAG TPA: hypothetical protein VMZ50_07020, partial [Phycisphaerae bacterium]|nr:hypothetical protein [Phycisphaerae bacterium]
NFATIVQGTNRIEGKEIRFRQTPAPEDEKPREPDRFASVNGPGALQFLTRKGLNGEPLADPTPIRITWKEGMAYRGPKNEVEFHGDVKLRSTSDKMDSGKMMVQFREVAAATQPASAPATRPGAEPAKPPGLGFDFENYSRRKITRIEADQDVMVFSERLDEQGRLLRQLQLTGEKLVYDADANEINVYKEGTLLVSDYRPPQRGTKRRPSGELATSPDDVERPFQAAFGWKELMNLSQDERSVIMKGDAWAVFASGRHVVLKELLNVPPWPKLTGGRLTRIRSEKLSATFHPPEEPALARPAPPAAQTGPRIGPLKSFYAEGGVHLIDGDEIRRVAECEKLSYDRETDIVMLLGSLPAQPRKPAKLRQEDPRTGRAQTFAGERITWYRKTDKITVVKAVGMGTR